jgi:hypothetical protein
VPSRGTVLPRADATTHRESTPALNATAQALGLTLKEATITAPGDFDRAIREAEIADEGGLQSCGFGPVGFAPSPGAARSPSKLNN